MSALSFAPRTGCSVPAPSDSSATELHDAARAAAAAARTIAGSAPAERATWLNAVAASMLAQRDALVDIADEETALGVTRLGGELDRAAAALRFYGSVAVEGSFLDATIDRRADGQPDLRRMNRPLGPVAVFGASNFPFAFGVLGHDTGSAIAAGCPVMVKAHPAHPRLSAALGQIAAHALDAQGAPPGTFGIVFGYASGTGLVTHPTVRAVAFTGSESGGMALWRLAATRARHIPVYAEMGTVNTAIVTPAGARKRAADIAAGFVASYTLGMGQFCTKPGLLLAPAGYDIPRLVADALVAAPPEGWLLTSGIAAAYAEGVGQLVEAGAHVVATTAAAPAGWGAAPTVLSVDALLLRPGSRLVEEVFGPVAVVAEYAHESDLDDLLDALPGSLAAAVHGTDDDPAVSALIDRLSERAGRVVVNGWPTGVAVSWAQHHGGPWPATTDPTASSVGASALGRFVRPTAYQEVPDSALPPGLQESNPWGIPRRVDGRRA